MVGIYKITNTLNNKSYIGQSIHIKQRWKEHIQASRNKEPQSLISKAIKKYGKENFKFEIIEQCKIVDLDEREIYWIKYYNSYSSGYNMTMGGESGYKYDPQTIFNVYLKTNSISETAKQIGCCTNVVRSAIDLFGVERKSTAKQPVERIDPKTLQVLESYESLYEAKIKTGFAIDTIKDAAIGNTSNCGGFYWRFKNDINKEFVPIKRLFKRKIVQINKDTNEIITEFDSISGACRALKIDIKSGSSAIVNVCKGKGRTAYGYKWRYKEE